MPVWTATPQSRKVWSPWLVTGFILPKMGAPTAAHSSMRNRLQRDQKEEWSEVCWTKRKSHHQGENVWPLARPLVVKSVLTISPCKFVECIIPLDNIFIAKKSLPQKINMFQRKFEWSFKRSNLHFCKRKRNATFKQYKREIMASCKSSCVGF